MKRDQKNAVEKAYESLRKNPEKFKEQFGHLSSKSHEELIERYRKDNKTSVVGAGGNW
jgi:hypothetical protein